MSDSFNLPKAAAAKMVEEHELGDLAKLKNTYKGGFYKDGKSLNDKSALAQRELTNDLTAPLKRMKVEYLNRVNESCYEDRHISDDFTNEEQINVCKQEQFQAVFGTYTKNLMNHRESDSIRFRQCVDDGGQDVERLWNCTDTYVKDMRATNEALKSLFYQTHKAYL